MRGGRSRRADAGRVRLLLQPASGSGAAQSEKLRAIASRIHRPSGQTQPRKRTRNWTRLGGKVNGQSGLTRWRSILDADPSAQGVKIAR
jgi:hypothetical protein